MYPIFKFLCITQITLGFFLVTTKEPNVEEKYSLTVEIDGIFNKTGILYAAVYNTKEDFMVTPYSRKKVEVQKFSNTLVFENLEEGNYAVAIYQDLNGNGKLDKVFKIPVEPYGLSNNPARFPQFEKQKILVDQNKTIKITIKN